ncbi:iron ABC transporter permease [Priestia filamentosa]|uniref:FecCD family ABC transporter permease n=1 Tax=Priestia filamentosa TaxID=1402861 RepID=UPI003857CEBF
MQEYKKQDRKMWTVMILLFIAIIGAFFLSLNIGYIKLAPFEVLQTTVGKGESGNEVILFDFRLPRMVIAILIGAGVGISGAIMQGVSKNDLADPGILGINAGAGFAVVLYIFFSGGTTGSLGAFSIFALPFTALLGALAAAILIYIISWKNGITPTRLVLVGIGINSAFAALLIIFQLKLSPNDFKQASIWLSGSIWGTSWTFVLAILPWVVLLIPFTLYKSRYLNVLNLGDQVATGLGTKVEKERRTLLIIAVALAGSSVSVGGGIAFLGLVAPHLGRRLVGPRHERFLPVTALIGALLLLVSDTLARNILAPSEIPVGLVVAVIGAPYFLYLLIKKA